MKKIFIEGKKYSTKIEDALLGLENDAYVNSILILSGDGMKISPQEIDPVLQSLKKPIIGGIFPEILFEGKRYSEGIIIVGMQSELNTIVIQDFDTSLQETIKSNENWNQVNPQDKSIFIFMDALIPNKNRIIDSLYNSYGTFPSYFGAGTGSLSFKPFPNIFSNEGLLESACILGISNTKASIGVAHGWEAITEPLKVTSSEGNVLRSINWRPALEVYQEIVETHSGLPVDSEHFFNTTKSYPFGINKMDSEMVVRDPFMHKDNCIYTLDDIEEGSFVHILYGNIDSLLNGAQSAREQADQSKKEALTESFIIDCISRVIFMGASFNEEILRLNPTNDGFGVLSLGEIANNGDSYLEIFNKTSVVVRMNG